MSQHLDNFSAAVVQAITREKELDSLADAVTAVVSALPSAAQKQVLVRALYRIMKSAEPAERELTAPSVKGPTKTKIIEYLALHEDASVKEIAMAVHGNGGAHACDKVRTLLHQLKSYKKVTSEKRGYWRVVSVATVEV